MSTPAATSSSSNAPLIHIIYWSLYGHIAQMAKEVAKGVEAAGGQYKIFQIKETLSDDVLAKMHAPPKDDSIPIATVEDLVNCDGILFGIPTRYGRAPSQVSALFDQTGGLWSKGALVGKPCGIFFSTATQAGGQETTALTTIPFLAHHGMLFVPLGYQNPGLFDLTAVHGGGPFGSGTLAAGDGSRQPSELEKGLAVTQGSSFTKVAHALKIGRAALP